MSGTAHGTKPGWLSIRRILGLSAVLVLVALVVCLLVHDEQASARQRGCWSPVPGRTVCGRLVTVGGGPADGRRQPMDRAVVLGLSRLPDGDVLVYQVDGCTAYNQHVRHDGAR